MSRSAVEIARCAASASSGAVDSGSLSGALSGMVAAPADHSEPADPILFVTSEMADFVKVGGLATSPPHFPGRCSTITTCAC